jgi:hypothetical protein
MTPAQLSTLKRFRFTSKGQRQKWKKALDEFTDSVGTWFSTRRIRQVYGFSRSAVYGWVDKGVPALPGLKLNPRREPWGPDNRELLFFLRANLDAIAAALRPRSPVNASQEEEVSIEKAASFAGVNRMTIYNWMDPEKGMPFADHRPLPSVERMELDAKGRPYKSHKVSLASLRHFVGLRDATDAQLVPAHKAQQMLSVCRKTVDNLRERGELPGVKKNVFRRNLMRIAWHYPIPKILELAERRGATPAPQEQVTGKRAGGGRHLDPKTQEVYKFCYVEYREKGRTRERVMNDARLRYGRRAPKEECVVTIYANRHADRHGLPRVPLTPR